MLSPLLFDLREKPKIDFTPLVPLLRSFCAFKGYDPDGLRQFESIRIDSALLLARRGDPAARALIERYLAKFPPERLDRTIAVGIVYELARIAVELGAPELAPDLQALLDTMLVEWDPPQRKRELAEANGMLRKLARTKRKSTQKPKTKSKAKAASR